MNWSDLFQDALFAAIAAIGFACISRPVGRAYGFCALIAALGHSLRYLLLYAAFSGLHIVAATFVASVLVGVMAVLSSQIIRSPAETLLFPALLPMIPGIYAYKAAAALAMCAMRDGQDAFMCYFPIFTFNVLTAGCILLAMVVGATLPVVAMKNLSFTATR